MGSHVAGLFVSMKISPKALKCLNLAIHPLTTDAEWKVAAVRFCALLRKDGASIDFPNRKNPIRQASEESLMPFGRFKGEKMDDLPDWYIEWMRDQDFIREPLKSSVEIQLQKRNL
jgi:uncharacterized protein (DUF3820 family)